MDLNILDIGYKAPPRKTILVVDDEISVHSVFSDAFSDTHTLISATSAKKGLQKAKLHQPDLIFMDVMFPDMNGYEAIKALRAYEETKNIPVVVMTGRDFDASNHSVSNSCVKWLVKS